eukprot:TRINITY_DN2790_c0_g1_i1.p1 TRINITY_DN2790_c0_g1~~TRINITY_DN2790_c0_g1_i1.p1  ORF type:complete len:212 (-),score=33.42 TRINITY_DN2790_c0_g1_i1:142-777(-)
MGNLLWAKQSKAVTNHDRAVLHLKIQRDKLQLYQKKLQAIIDRETEIARQLLRENKRDRAKLAIARRKHQENLLAKADQHLENIQDMVDSIEFTTLEVKVVEGLKIGAETLKQLQKEISVDAVEKIMEESAEAIAWHDEVSRILAESLTPEDNSDIEEQIAVWEAEDLRAKLHGVQPPFDVPPMPVEKEPDLVKVSAAEYAEDDESQLVPA